MNRTDSYHRGPQSLPLNSGFRLPAKPRLFSSRSILSRLGVSAGLSVLAAVLLLGAAAPAFAQTTLVTNFGQMRPSATLILGDSGGQHNRSYSFVTGDNNAGYVLEDITINMAPGIPGSTDIYSPVTMEVFAADTSNNNFHTGEALYTLTAPATLTSGRNLFTAPSDAFLSPNTTYAVKIDGPTGSFNGLTYTRSTSEDGGAARGWRLSDGSWVERPNNDDVLEWETSDSLPLMDIRGTINYSIPTLANAIPEQTARLNLAFSYVIPADTFSDDERYALTYTAAQTDGTPLPSWLSFDAASQTFSGTPPSDELPGTTVSVRVSVDDGQGGMADGSFDITVGYGAPFPLFDAPRTGVDGDLLTLIFHASLDPNSVPAASAFRALVDGEEAAFTAVGIEDEALTLTLAEPVIRGQRVTLSYAVPATNPLQDSDGNPVVAFTDYMIATFNNDAAITNAWFTRYGRAAAEQVLDAITARLRATRTPGFRASLAGRSFQYAAGEHNDSTSAALTTRTVGLPELLRTSNFSLTGADGDGSNLTVWGRGGLTSFEANDDVSEMEGYAASAMLGADYGSELWTVGLALMQSEGKGDFVEPDGASGELESSLTAAVPFGAWQASEKVNLWGAGGHGQGDMTLTPQGDEAVNADITWSMAAAGLRANLVDSANRSAVTLVADGLWTRTSSDGSETLDAVGADATRLRIGVEGNWHSTTQNGGQISPAVWFGIRHDDSNTESDTGIEFGGGAAWQGTSGLAVEIEARTLVVHHDLDFSQHSLAASLIFDPTANSARGPSLTLRQQLGNPASGRLDAVFADAPLAGQGGTAEPSWRADAAWGFSALKGRYTASPHIGLDLSATSRDYSLGWRLTPETRTAAPLSLGVTATRRERGRGRTEHRLEATLAAHW